MWRMLYETAACWAEVFALNVEDLDLPGRGAKIRRQHRRARRSRGRRDTRGQRFEVT